MAPVARLAPGTPSSSMRRLLTHITLLACLLVGSASAQQGKIGWEDGQFVPDLELPTIDGERTVRLSEFRGQRVLLIQFASW